MKIVEKEKEKMLEKIRNTCARNKLRQIQRQKIVSKFPYRQHRKKECEICQTTEKLDAHHLDKNLMNNKKSNIMTLCKNCHHKLHSKEPLKNSAL